ncbi:MAG: hemerythrin domain-containing protein, partial [Candidatus Riflemargulisbacteria bacterium]
MNEILNKPIKEVINQYPPVADILNEYNIGCVPCQVGTCLLKDVVNIHHLEETDERDMLTRILGVVYPDQVIVLPKKEQTVQAKKHKSFSPPLKTLVDEHIWIKRLLALIPTLLQKTDITSTEGQALILNCVDFIRNYADKFHHAKEEDILFKYFDPNMAVIQAMLHDHITGRNFVAAAVARLEEKDAKGVASNLEGYQSLLMEHIKREDEILYPWMDENLSMSQIGQLQNL